MQAEAAVLFCNAMVRVGPCPTVCAVGLDLSERAGAARSVQCTALNTQSRCVRRRPGLTSNAID